jgi:Flp pilus assembly CpaE family ATPase
VDIFSTGGGEQTARDFDLPFLGRVPMDPRVVMAGDTGIPYLSTDEDTPATKAFNVIVTAVEQRLPPGPVTVNPFSGGCGCTSGGCGTSFK